MSIVKNRLLAGTATFVLIGAISASSVFADESYPRIEGEVGIELNNLYIFDSDDPDSEINDLYSDSEVGLSVLFNEWLSVESTIKLESVEDGAPGDDRYLEDLGMFFEELYISADFGNVGLMAGKYNPGFGVAYDALPGVFAEEISKEDYELAERIAIGGVVRFGSDAFGQAELSASTFYADTSFLSESILNNRGQVDVLDGGSSNTEDFDSYVVSLDIENVVGVEGLNLHVAYRDQEAGVGDFGDDEGLAVAAYGSFELANGTTISPLIEYVDLENANGAAEDREILTASTEVGFGKWRVAATYIDREVSSNIMASSYDDKLYEVTAGYDFDCGVSLTGGYLNADLGGVESDGLVGKLNYSISF